LRWIAHVDASSTDDLLGAYSGVLNWFFNVLSFSGAAVLVLAYVLQFFSLLGSLRYGARAPMNPWEAAGLEWRIPSPPPEHNFAAPVTVNFEAYDYAPGADRDPL